MTEILSSASFPNGAECNRSEADYRRARDPLSMLDTIRNGVPLKAAGAVPSGMSDEDYAWEIGAQQRLQRAIREMTSAIKQVNTDCSTVQISEAEWGSFLHDSIPDEKWWNEKIMDARRG